MHPKDVLALAIFGTLAFIALLLLFDMLRTLGIL